ncbi:MAG: hypothetical protein ACRCX2_33915 [Paraclostridium sp.]
MDNKPKRVAISFSSKAEDQSILKFLESQKNTVGISDYIKNLIKNDSKFLKQMEGK